MGGIGLVSNLLGKRKQSRAQAEALEAQARAREMRAGIARENAGLVEQRIGDAYQRGGLTKQRIGQQALTSGGAQQASFGAANVDIGFGSPLDAVYEGFANMQRDFRQTDRNTGYEVDDLRREQKNFLDEARVLDAEAGSSRRAAGNTRSAGLLDMFTSAASGAADIYASIQ